MVKVEKKPPNVLQGLWNAIKAPLIVPQTEGHGDMCSIYGYELKDIPQRLKDGQLKKAPLDIPPKKFQVIGYNRDVFDGGGFYIAGEFDTYEHAKKQAVILSRGDDSRVDQGGYVVDNQRKLLFEAGCYVPPGHFHELKKIREQNNKKKVNDDIFFRRHKAFLEEYKPFVTLANFIDVNKNRPAYLEQYSKYSLREKPLKRDIKNGDESLSYISKQLSIKAALLRYKIIGLRLHNSWSSKSKIHIWMQKKTFDIENAKKWADIIARGDQSWPYYMAFVIAPRNGVVYEAGFLAGKSKDEIKKELEPEVWKKLCEDLEIEP